MSLTPYPNPDSETNSLDPAYLAPDDVPRPISLPSVPIAKTRDLGYFDEKPSPSPPPDPSSDESSDFPTLPSLTPLPRPRIPRPPNAFMLYRSDFLKRKIIPDHIEKRQQALSKVAGECWNLLPETERNVWKERAAKELERHQELYPDYKFTPAPKGSSRKAKAKSGLDGRSEDQIRELRERYVKIAGPARPGSREKRRKKNTKRNLYRIVLDIPRQEHCSPSEVDLSELSYPTSETGDTLPPFFPHPSYPHFTFDHSLSSGTSDEESKFSMFHHYTAPTSYDSTSLKTQPGCGLSLDLIPHETLRYNESSYSSLNTPPFALEEGNYHFPNVGCNLLNPPHKELPFTSPLMPSTPGDFQMDKVNPQASSDPVSYYYPGNHYEYSTWNLTPNGDYWQYEVVPESQHCQ